MNSTLSLLPIAQETFYSRYLEEKKP